MGIVETPTDELSGLPLLLVPDERTLPIFWGFEPSRGPDGRLLVDQNHIWHPAKEVVEAGEGGAALRNSRVQFVLRHEQHNPYHGYYYGPPLPQTVDERFRTTVLCAAGYIPPRAIAFGPDGPCEVDLNEWQMVRLRESGEVQVASFSVVQSFMREFVMAQPVDHIKPKTIDRFLRIDPSESADAGREHAYLTHLLLSLVIDRVEDPLAHLYRRAHQSELLSPYVPERPDQFILSTIVRSHKNIRSIAREFAQRLSAEREGRQLATCLGNAAMVGV